jgi:hypothetical protein
MLDKGECHLHTVLKRQSGGDYERLMDCQYEYVFVNPFDHNGFLPHHTSQCADQMVEKRMRKFQIANCRLKIERLKVKSKI